MAIIDDGSHPENYMLLFLPGLIWSHKEINNLSQFFSHFSMDVRNVSKVQIPGYYLLSSDSVGQECTWADV